MNEVPTKENTLYLPIKQIYFDEIIAGTKKEEYREVKEGMTANRYLIKDTKTKYALNPDVTDPNKEYFVDDYNNGNFPSASEYPKSPMSSIQHPVKIP